MAKRPRDWSPRGRIPAEDPIWPIFVDTYLRAALSSTPDRKYPDHWLDERFRIDQFDQESINLAVAQTNDFIMMNRKDLEAVGNIAQHGHDFWMSRNMVGVDFESRHYGPIGNRLTASARTFGFIDIIETPEGKLHLRP